MRRKKCLPPKTRNLHRHRLRHDALPIAIVCHGSYVSTSTSKFIDRDVPGNGGIAIGIGDSRPGISSDGSSIIDNIELHTDTRLVGSDLYIHGTSIAHTVGNA